MKRKEIIAETSAATNRKSNVLDLGDLKDCSVQVIFTGADVVGTLTLEASNNEADWVDVDSSEQAVTASTGHMWNLSVANYQYLRIDWVYTSGTGNIKAVAIIKENPITGA